MYAKPQIDELDLDPDNDGLSTGQEIALGSDPYQFDTDGDGISDTMEVKKQSNPRIETVPLNDPKAAREKYYHHASELLGWENFSGLSWDTLYQDIKGQFELGWSLDRLVYERAINQGETTSNAVYLLAQSPFLQYHKDRGLISLEDLKEYTQELVAEVNYSQEKINQNKPLTAEPELED